MSDDEDSVTQSQFAAVAAQQPPPQTPQGAGDDANPMAEGKEGGGPQGYSAASFSLIREARGA